MKPLFSIATTAAMATLMLLAGRPGLGYVQAQEQQHGHEQKHQGHEQGHQGGHSPMMEDGMSDQMTGHMRMMMNTELSPRDPAALLGMKDQLELTDEQVEQLRSLAEKTRRQTVALLTEAQRGQVAQMPEEPQSMMQMHRQMMGRMKGMSDMHNMEQCPMCSMMMQMHGGQGGMMEQGEGAAAQPAERVDLNAEAQAALDQIVKSYMAVQQQLAQDKMKGVVAQLTELHDAAHGLLKANSAKIKEQARAVAGTVHSQPENLGEARKVFKALSAEVIELTDLALPSDEVAPALYQVHCPMAKASWLQTGREIVNPYMGQDMLRCGEIERTVKTPPEG